MNAESITKHLIEQGLVHPDAVKHEHLGGNITGLIITLGPRPILVGPFDDEGELCELVQQGPMCTYVGYDDEDFDDPCVLVITEAETLAAVRRYAGLDPVTRTCGIHGTDTTDLSRCIACTQNGE